MQTTLGHLTYCTNIHTGETWDDHFTQLKLHVPKIKQQVSPLEPFAIGLRLANAASIELEKNDTLEIFQHWLSENNCYIFTMNGFPYGSFHDSVVKDKVHAPDWLTADRVNYTIRLAHILCKLLPEELDGGISTNTLSYKFWHKEEDLPGVYETATKNILQVVDALIKIKAETGKLIHIDMEPEPDGLLGDGKEFLQWYIQYLLPMGIVFLQEKYGYNEDTAAASIREHIQVCYDVCHFAVGYEDHYRMIEEMKALGIKTGKIQISAALKAALPQNSAKRTEIINTFKQFDEPNYLHQVVAQKNDGQLIRYVDMSPAIEDGNNPNVKEWRAHFHVPLFISDYGVLQSTNDEIEQVLAIHAREPFTFHLEVETYTWGVLPENLKLPISESISRELLWVIDVINKQTPSEGR